MPSSPWCHLWRGSESYASRQHLRLMERGKATPYIPCWFGLGLKITEHRLGTLISWKPILIRQFKHLPSLSSSSLVLGLYKTLNWPPRWTISLLFPIEKSGRWAIVFYDIWLLVYVTSDKGQRDQWLFYLIVAVALPEEDPKLNLFLFIHLKPYFMVSRSNLPSNPGWILHPFWNCCRQGGGTVHPSWGWVRWKCPWTGYDGSVLGWMRWMCPGLGAMEVSWAGCDESVLGRARKRCPRLGAMYVSWSCMRWKCPGTGCDGGVLTLGGWAGWTAWWTAWWVGWVNGMG